MTTFYINEEPYEVQLTQVKQLYSEDYEKLYVAQTSIGRYYPNIIHNYRTGIYCQNEDGSIDILMPFIFKKIKQLILGYCVYYYALYEAFGKSYISIYVEEGGRWMGSMPFRCLEMFSTQKMIVNRQHYYIRFYKAGKTGIIRHGIVMIQPLYTSVLVYGLEMDDEDDFDKEYSEKLLFVVTQKGKNGIFIEDKELLPVEYDSINFNEQSKTMSLVKDNHFYKGTFKNDELSIREISKDDFFASETDEDDEDECDYNEWDRNHYSDYDALYDALGGEMSAYWNIE